MLPSLLMDFYPIFCKPYHNSKHLIKHVLDSLLFLKITRTKHNLFKKYNLFAICIFFIYTIILYTVVTKWQTVDKL